jgi:large-conductance mechanosensitive channel
MLSQEQIKDFVVQNNVLGYAIAMIIALTLKDFVASFIGNFIVPAINLFLIQLQIKSLTKFLPGNEVVDILPIVKSLLTFILTFLTLPNRFSEYRRICLLVLFPSRLQNYRTNGAHGLRNAM